MYKHNQCSNSLKAYIIYVIKNSKSTVMSVNASHVSCSPDYHYYIDFIKFILCNVFF